MTFACGLYDRMLALYTGDVRPEGIDLKFLVNDSPHNIFDRLSGHLEFDSSEMQSSEFITRTDAGEQPFAPFRYSRRAFFHTAISR